MKPLAIYVHWPWCLKKCPYCDFNSHEKANFDEETYLKALRADLYDQYTKVGKRSLTSIFFGGGTPSLASAHFIGSIISEIDKCFTVTPETEITLEANPTSSNAQKFADFATAGINRFSIGVQSLSQQDLSFLGRDHSAQEALYIIQAACQSVSNVNLDLIYGLPHQQLSDWEGHLQTAIELGTTHISAYQLTIEPNTKFFSEVRKQKWMPMDMDCQADFFECTQSTLEQHGFENYEISNFAKPYKNCKHNTHIWEYNDYLGLGAGAHGRYTNQQGVRIATQNYKMPEKYMAQVLSQPTQAQFCIEDTPPSQAAQEAILMGLRLKKGVSMRFIEKLSQNGIDKPSISTSDFSFLEFKQRANRLRQLGFLNTNAERLQLTTHGWLLLDSILTELLFD